MAAERTASQASKPNVRSSEGSRASSNSGGRSEVDTQKAKSAAGNTMNGNRANGHAWTKQQGSPVNGNASEGSSSSTNVPQGRQPRPRYDRQPSGFPPACRDVVELCNQVAWAKAGTGQVAQVLKQSTFRPREPAFTRLIQACVPSHDWEKATEIWDIMRSSPELKPNTITYSVLIHVCGATGRWKEAEDLFKQQLKAAETDKNCLPNHITYSSLLTACTRGKRIDKALEWYQHMTDAGINADTITFSSLIPGCFDNGVPLDRILRLVDDMHAAGQIALPDTYVRLLQALGQKGDWAATLEAFISALMAGTEPTVELALALLQACEACKKVMPVGQLLDSWAEALGSIPPPLYAGGVRVLMRLGAWQRVLSLWEAKIKPAKVADPELARMLLDAADKSDKKDIVAEMTKEFQVLGLKPSSKAQA